MKIIVLNGLRFVAPLRALGHEVRSFGELAGCDHRLVIAGQHIDNVLKLAGFQPDLILVEVFGGAAPFFRGIEQCPFPMAVYAVDSSINLFWMRHYLTLFDAVFVDQADAAYLLRRAGIRAVWLPLAIDPALYESSQRTNAHDIVFVGRITPGRLKRHNCIRLLQQRYSVHVVGKEGDPWLSEQQLAALFASSKIVLNENLFNGVTLRVFQGMASGAMLLTEEAGNGLFELFTDGRHLVAFTPETLLEKAGRYLADENERRAVAQAGQAEILAKHTLRHRAETILEACVPIMGRRQQRKKAYRLSEAAKAYALLAERFFEQAPLFLARTEQAAHAVLQDTQASRRARAQAFEALGRCLITGGHPLDALEPLFQAMRLAPRNPAPCFFLGHLLLRQQRVQQAIPFLQNGLRRLDCPHKASVTTAAELTAAGSFHTPKIWSAYAKVLTACGTLFDPGFIKHADTATPETAVEYYQLALRQGGGADALKDLAGCYEQAGIWDLAYTHLIEALDQNPADKSLVARCTRAHALCYHPPDPLLRLEQAQGLQRIRTPE